MCEFKFDINQLETAAGGHLNNFLFTVYMLIVKEHVQIEYKMYYHGCVAFESITNCSYFGNT